MGSDNFGHVIVFSQEDDQNVVYYPNGEGPEAELERLEADAHALPLYRSRLETLLSQDASIGLDGWETGVLCAVDHECQTKKCLDTEAITDIRKCSAGAIGDACQSDSDCESGSCARFQCTTSTSADDGGQSSAGSRTSVVIALVVGVAVAAPLLTLKQL